MYKCVNVIIPCMFMVRAELYMPSCVLLQLSARTRILYLCSCIRTRVIVRAWNSGFTASIIPLAGMEIDGSTDTIYLLM